MMWFCACIHINSGSTCVYAHVTFYVTICKLCLHRTTQMKNEVTVTIHMLLLAQPSRKIILIFFQYYSGNVYLYFQTESLKVIPLQSFNLELE